jgi:enoyl-CoA hydratase
MTPPLTYAVEDRIATLTLDSPHNRNALSRALLAALTEGLARAAADPAVRAVVLTHTGTVFCAGADLAEAGAGSMAEGTRAVLALLTAIVELPKPVVARVDGHVRAGGLGIVGACDLAVASAAASFAFTEARIGVAPAIISLTTLDIMEPRAAARYYLTGEKFDARTAVACGLLTLAAGDEADLDRAVAGLLDGIRQTSPQGAAESKRLVTAERTRAFRERGAELVELSARLFGSPEAQEGIHAFLERRAPAWR